MTIKNLAQAASRIRKAARAGEPIVIYGDGDLDGITSVIIMKEAVQSAGGRIEGMWFSDRERDGYGIVPSILERFPRPSLLIALDLGITNHKEVEEAKRMGFDLIIIDHHAVVDGVPNADIVVDPKQPGDRYPFKEFAACGLAFKAAEEILGAQMSPALRGSLLELAALGTIADMMPLKEDNARIVSEGFGFLLNSWRPGIRAFLDRESLNFFENPEEKVRFVVSVLGIRLFHGEVPAAYAVLTASDQKEAGRVVDRLEKKHRRKQEAVNSLVADIKARVGDHPIASVLVERVRGRVEHVMLGAVASVLAREYQLPVFLYKQGRSEALGSARAVGDMDTVKAMHSCGDIFVAFGGHPRASGFRISLRNLEAFRSCLRAYFEKS